MPTVDLPPVPSRPTRRRRAVGIAVAAVIASWACGIVGPLSILVPVIPLTLLLLRRPWSAAISLLLSPIGVAFASGAVGYCTGHAYLRGVGLPSTAFYNLDPDLRCGHSTSGCIVMGGEWLTHGPNNLAVRTLTRWFGPQRNTYRGPYPTAMQAITAVADGTEVSLADLRTDTFHVGKVIAHLDTGVGEGLLRSAGATYDPLWPAAELALVQKELGPIRAVVWKDSCLIIRIPVGSVDEQQGGPQPACVAVCDLTKGRPFAYYADGAYHHRFPPVRWEKR